jgi:class 3 adenylate cyclase/pimeloyl-ACP methyl ester carboxylesterase
MSRFRLLHPPIEGEDASVVIPETKYAWNGDIALAYQTLGDGPIDLLFIEGYASNVEVNWEGPNLARFLRGLAGHARLIVTDRRGYGLSDRFTPTDVQPLEANVQDFIAVLDAAGSERAAIFGTMFAGIPAALFAATHPERTSGLILYQAFATYSATAETPWMYGEEDWEETCRYVHATIGTPRWAAEMGVAPEEQDWHNRWVRSAIAPGAAVAEFRSHLNTDIRGVLPSIHVPTLVLDKTGGEGFDSPENGRFLASRIPGARLVEFPRDSQFSWDGGGVDIVAEVGRFLAGIRNEEAEFDRVLATVMFTDIVGSTAKNTELGDLTWTELVERHHAVVRAMIARYRGQEIDTAGDGFFATFDGPARGVRCAQQIIDAVGPLGLEVRTGVHTGEVQTIDGKAGGLGVVIGARVGALATASEVLVSQTVKDLVVGSGLTFEDAGEHELKGVPDRWHLYRVVS